MEAPIDKGYNFQKTQCLDSTFHQQNCRPRPSVCDFNRRKNYTHVVLVPRALPHFYIDEIIFLCYNYVVIHGFSGYSHPTSTPNVFVEDSSPSLPRDVIPRPWFPYRGGDWDPTIEVLSTLNRTDQVSRSVYPPQTIYSLFTYLLIYLYLNPEKPGFRMFYSSTLIDT